MIFTDVSKIKFGTQAAHKVFVGTTKVWEFVQQVDDGEYNGVNIDLSPLGGTGGFSFGKDGTRLYKTDGSDQGNIYQLNLSVAWDISTAVLARTWQPPSQYQGAVYITNDGLTLYVPDPTFGVDAIRKYTLGTAYELLNPTYVGIYDPFSGSDVHGIYVTPDGTKAVMHQAFVGLKQYTLSTPYQLDTAGTPDTSLDTTAIAGINWSDDGLKMWGVKQVPGSDKFYEGETTTPYNLTNMVITEKKEVGETVPGVTTCYGSRMNTDRTRMYVTDGNYIYQIDFDKKLDNI